MKIVLKKLTTPLFVLKQGFDGLSRRLYMFIAMSLTGLFSMMPGWAIAGVGTIGDVGNRAGDQSTGLTSGALRIAGFLGFVMVIIAIVKGRSAKQQGEGIGVYVGMGILGALLLAVPTLVSIFNVTLLGTDASQDMQGQIIQ